MIGHPLAPFDAKIQRLYAVATSNAPSAVGGIQVFQFLQPVLRKALVAEAIMELLWQNDDAPDARFRELFDQLIAANNAMFAEDGV